MYIKKWNQVTYGSQENNQSLHVKDIGSMGYGFLKMQFDMVQEK